MSGRVGEPARRVAPRVVALGGGHGLSASLQALRQVTPHVTAVVTVADDGGSSGRLRDELGILPPGDLRMALAALAGRDDWGRTWETLLQHRFGGDGPLSGHAVGNLLLAGLTGTTGDPVMALDLAARLLGVPGTSRVLPMSCTPLVVCADVEGQVERVVGQVAVATTTRRVTAVHLQPADPQACAESVAAVLDADWVVLGPGSWFTSVLPHLLVPGLREALVATGARRLVCLNLAEQAGETSGMTPQAHLEVLTAHAPELRLDVVLADREAVGDPRSLMTAVAAAGAHLELAPVSRGDGTPRHHPDRLAEAYSRVMTRDPARRDARDPVSRAAPISEAPAWR